jgi:endogenous inhibitor of DNA gyrase (YacG/DUF329 family)
MKIEIRADCKVCGGEIVYNRYRTYCSKECRTKGNNQKYAEYSAKWQKEKRDRIKYLCEYFIKKHEPLQ